MFEVSKKGVSIYLALMIMFILLAIGLGISTILVSQMKMIREMGYSVIAFYAADTGIEEELYEMNIPPWFYSDFLDLDGDGGGLPGSCPETLQDPDDACYKVEVIAAGEADCPSPPATNRCIRSAGIFRGTSRAIKVTR